MKDNKSKLFFTRSIGLLIMIAVSYLFVKGTRYSKLVSFFIFMSISCSILPLPTPPYVIGIGKIFHPLFVALVASIGSCIAAFLEYHFITWLFSKTELQRKIEESKSYQKIKNFFNKTAFSCITFTAFLPIPFDPVRFAAILTRYFLPRYLLAIFIGKYPRYYLLAYIGESFQVSNQILLIMLFVLVLIPIFAAFISRQKQTSQ